MDRQSRQYLQEIRERYDIWKEANEKLKGPLSASAPNDSDIIEQRVTLFTEYKDFIDQQKYAEKFDSRSNLHSSVLEEFIFYLFRDLVYDFSGSSLIGKAHTFKDLFFQPSNYTEMVRRPSAKIEKKDHDFVIGVDILVLMACQSGESEEYLFQIPAVAVECKTYLDKTMLEGSSTAAEQLKNRSPNAIYIVVAEWLKLTGHVNIRKFKVDQIYILRKQKNTDREFRFLDGYLKNQVYPDVVKHLYQTIKSHLTSDWEGGVTHGLERGYLL